MTLARILKGHVLVWCGPSLGGSLGTHMGTYRISRQGNKVLRNRRRLQETEPRYTEPIPGGHPREGTPPSLEKPRPLVLRLLEEPHLKVRGREDRGVGWPIPPHQHTRPRNGPPYKVGVARGGEDPAEQGAFKKGPSANDSRFCHMNQGSQAGCLLL